MKKRSIKARPPRPLRATWVAPISAVLLVLIGLAIFYTFRSPIETSPPAPTGSLSPGPTAPAIKCPPAPPLLASVSSRDLQIAALNLGRISLGTFHAREQPQAFELLQKAARDALAIDYLVCQAEARGEIDPKDPKQTDYLRRFWEFSSTNPTPAELEQWQRENRLPEPDSEVGPAALVAPDFTVVAASGGHRRRFELESLKGREFHLANAADKSFRIWLEQFPSNDFLAVPQRLLSSTELRPNAQPLTERLVPLISPDFYSDAGQENFRLATNTHTHSQDGVRDPSEASLPAEYFSVQVDITFRDLQAIRRELTRLVERLGESIARKAADLKPTARRRQNDALISPAYADTANAASDDAYTAVIRTAGEVIRSEMDLPPAAAYLYADYFFEALNWPQLGE